MKEVIRIAILALILCSMAIQAASAEQVSMILGRITVNGQPQDGVAVSGFGATTLTRPDGEYVLEFENAGAGAINASYNGYHTNSGLIVLPSSPQIKVKDLDIVIPENASGAEATASGVTVTEGQNTHAATVWTQVPAPTATEDEVKLTVGHQPVGVSEFPILFTGVLCGALICFLIYVMVKK